jgi:hypothetical protein
VPEVEDVARASTRAAQDVVRLPLDAVPRAEKKGGLEIALDGPLLPDGRPCVVEPDAPVDADGASARGAISASRCVVTPVPKWIVGTPAASSTRAE